MQVIDVLFPSSHVKYQALLSHDFTIRLHMKSAHRSCAPSSRPIFSMIILLLVILIGRSSSRSNDPFFLRHRLVITGNPFMVVAYSLGASISPLSSDMNNQRFLVEDRLSRIEDRVKVARSIRIKYFCLAIQQVSNGMFFANVSHRSPLPLVVLGSLR